MITLYLGGALMLLFLGYVLWGGVGQVRPAMGRGFGALALLGAAYLIWQLADMMT